MPYISKSVVWNLFLFGVVWQFLRWFFLTKWLVKNIEHWISHLAKLLLNQVAEYLKIVVQFIIENGKNITQEIWKYRAGKITICLLCIYLIYILIF